MLTDEQRVINTTIKHSYQGGRMPFYWQERLLIIDSLITLLTKEYENFFGKEPQY